MKIGEKYRVISGQLEGTQGTLIEKKGDLAELEIDLFTTLRTAKSNLEEIKPDETISDELIYPKNYAL